MEKADLLKLEYPAYANNIDRARDNGYRDEKIHDYLNKREIEAHSSRSLKDVDKLFGRTVATWKKFWAVMETQHGIEYINQLNDDYYFTKTVTEYATYLIQRV